MKKLKIILLLGFYTLLFSCKPAIDKKAINDYYFFIQTMSEKQDSSYSHFLNTFGTYMTKANESEGRRLDSSDLAILTTEYNTFMDELKSDITQLKNLKEVDNEINLKYNYEKHIVFVDSTLGDVMPKILSSLKIGLDSVDNDFRNELNNLNIVVGKEQSQREKNDELSLKFRQRYPD
jgi:hypothetical protein